VPLSHPREGFFADLTGGPEGIAHDDRQQAILEAGFHRLDENSVAEVLLQGAMNQKLGGGGEFCL
jgi:hypothetical protein